MNIREILKIDERYNSSCFNSEGNARTVQLRASVQEIDVSSNITLSQNTPNPFSDYTDIDFYLDKNNSSIFSIHDLAGQLVYQKKDNFNLGWNRLRFAPDQIAPGVYIYSITQGQEKQIKKMVIAR